MKSLSRGHLRAGLGSLRGAKLRNFWTMLGVIIGVTSVISVVAIGEGVKQQVEGQVHHFGKNLISVRPAQLTAGHSTDSLTASLGIGQAMSMKDIAIVSHTKGIASSAPLTIVSGSPKGDQGAYQDGFVVGTSPDLPDLLNQTLVYGDFFGKDDTGRNVAVLGQAAAEALFNEDVPLGRTFTFHGQQFIVRGIFNEFSATPLSQQADLNNAIFIPNDIAETLTDGTAPTYEILAKPTNPSTTTSVVHSLQQTLDKAHGGDSNLSVLTGDQAATANDNVLELLTRLIAGVAAISLLVGGIGIMNVMLVSVAERTHEIGIRKAVGATNRQILSQFMVESTVLSLTGGIIGIILSGLIDIGIRLATDLQPRIVWQVVVGATVVSLLVGVVFGSFPALKAARKDPIDALRSE